NPPPIGLLCQPKVSAFESCARRQIFLTSKFSPPFWIAEKHHLQGEMGNTAESRVSQAFATSPADLPGLARWCLSKVNFSVSPPSAARLVDCASPRLSPA